MAKKSSKSDRQAVIDEIRKKQKGVEKRRGYAIVGVCSMVALLIVVAAAYRPVKNWWDLRKFNDLDLASIGAPASACDKITTKPADGSSEHVPTNSQVTYSTAPPAFGAHWNEQNVAPAPFNIKMYKESDRPELESLVHNLEHGYTILWYDESIADDADELNVIDGIADKFRSDSDQPAAEVHRRALDLRRREGGGRQRQVPRRHARRLLALVGRRLRRERHLQAGRRLPVLQPAERRGAEGLHAGVPLHRLARAERNVMVAPTRIAIVSGYFNPIHIGHLRMIKAARELAPHLVVIVNNDKQQLLKKGRILMTEEDRHAIVAELRCVDEAFVAVDDDSTVVASLRRVRELHPDAELLFCNGGDRVPDRDAVPSAEAHLAEEIGLQLVYGVGGEHKADSSSRINEELSRADVPAGPTC